MSDSGSGPESRPSYPSPGSGGHEPPAPSYQQPQYGAATQTGPAYAPIAPAQALPAAHRPGAIPIRPLGLGDLYDGAFRIIRKNGAATVGASVLVLSLAMAIPVLIVAAVTASYGDLPVLGGFGSAPPTDPTAEQLAGSIAGAASNLLTAIGQWIAVLLVTGMVTHVVAEAVMGRQVSLGDAWTATRGRRWRLIGLSALQGLCYLLLWSAWGAVLIGLWFATESPVAVGIVGVFSFLATVPLCVWLYIRYFALAVPPLMLERTGVFGAFGRNQRLVDTHFWRTLGILLLTSILGAIAASMLTFPLSLGGQGLLALDGEVGLMATTLLTAVVTIISSALVTPFTAAVVCLQYVDLRMRREGFDLVLLQAAGLMPSGPPAAGR
ncbi:MAG: DUF7544 domain-containing protein [Nocardioides sp.]